MSTFLKDVLLITCISIAGSFAVILYVYAWHLFEDTELWEMIRKRIEKKERKE